jgi:hypothetical protein
MPFPVTQPVCHVTGSLRYTNTGSLDFVYT